MNENFLTPNFMGLFLFWIKVFIKRLFDLSKPYLICVLLFITAFIFAFVNGYINIKIIYLILFIYLS